MTDEELAARLEELEAEEERISGLRRHLHDRLAMFPNDSLLDQEQELSRRRRELHAEIDELRSERSRRRAAAGTVDDAEPGAA